MIHHFSQRRRNITGTRYIVVIKRANVVRSSVRRLTTQRVGEFKTATLKYLVVVILTCSLSLENNDDKTLVPCIIGSVTR